jgi:hypothetical protein
VREDYSPDGTAWEYFPHEHARSRAYRWNEDGLAGISDRQQTVCVALGCGTGRTRSSRNGSSASPATGHDGFYYDVLHFSNGDHFPLRLRSMVGLIPLFAVETLEPKLLEKLPAARMVPPAPAGLTANVASVTTPGTGERRLLSIVNLERLRRVLKVMLDEEEFFSPHGVRALSRVHRDHLYS